MDTEKNAGKAVKSLYYEDDMASPLRSFITQAITMAGLSHTEEQFSADYAIMTPDYQHEDLNALKIVIIESDDEFANEGGHVMVKPPLRLGTLVDILLRFQRGYTFDYPEKIDVHDYIFYVRSYYLQDQKSQDIIRLTEKERDLLFYLIQNAGKTVTRDELLDVIWGYHQAVETHTVETHFYRLRQKIECDASNPSILKTNDDGYIFCM